MTLDDAVFLLWHFIIGSTVTALLLSAWLIGARVLAAASKRIARAVDKAGIAAADIFGVLLALPFEWVADRADRFIASSAEWRAQRKIWRRDFRQTMSWDEFQAAMTGTAKTDAWSDALGLFGLSEPFDRKTFETRFKQIMMRVHPDQGGSEYLARLASDARAMIFERKGWKR